MTFRFAFVPRFPAPVKAAFLDRDGVINIDHAYVGSRTHFQFIDGALKGLRILVEKGFLPVLVTNQSGIGRAKYSLRQFGELTLWLAGKCQRNGSALGAVYFCPHHPTSAFAPYLKECACRKPRPGMILDAARDLNIDLAASVLIGDKESDILAAQAAGVSRRFLVKKDGIYPFASCSAPHEEADNLLTAAQRL